MPPGISFHATGEQKAACNIFHATGEQKAARNIHHASCEQKKRTCIKKERAGYSFINLFIIVAPGEMNLMK